MSKPDEVFGLETIKRHTYGVADLADQHPLDTPVPTCGTWTLAALAWHLIEVQRFWVHIIEQRPDATPASYTPPTPPDDERVLATQLRATCDRLVTLLEEADPSEPAWSWSENHTVGFTRRRQAHESFVHHVDAALAVNEPIPEVEAEFASDGIDEVVQVMLCETPPWARFNATGGAVRLKASDTGDLWTLLLGEVTGANPETGQTFRLDGFALDRAAQANAIITAPATQLDLWLWGRPATGIITRGDTELVQQFRKVLLEVTS